MKCGAFPANLSAVRKSFTSVGSEDKFNLFIKTLFPSLSKRFVNSSLHRLVDAAAASLILYHSQLGSLSNYAHCVYLHLKRCAYAAQYTDSDLQRWAQEIKLDQNGRNLAEEYVLLCNLPPELIHFIIICLRLKYATVRGHGGFASSDMDRLINFMDNKFEQMCLQMQPHVQIRPPVTRQEQQPSVETGLPSADALNGEVIPMPAMVLVASGIYAPITSLKGLACATVFKRYFADSMHKFSKADWEAVVPNTSIKSKICTVVEYMNQTLPEETKVKLLAKPSTITHPGLVVSWLEDVAAAASISTAAIVISLGIKNKALVSVAHEQILKIVRTK